jgi:hypothetical protein
VSIRSEEEGREGGRKGGREGREGRGREGKERRQTSHDEFTIKTQINTSDRTKMYCS